MKRYITIIGAGVAGLTAGIYARKCGFETTILEMHTIPGGNCTSWKRGGYLFEGGMHWLNGTKGGTFLNDLWNEVGALQENNPIYIRDPYSTWMHNGEKVCLYRDPCRLEQHFNEISPNDRKATHKLCRDLKKFGAIQLPAMNAKGVKMCNKKTTSVGTLFKMVPSLLRMGEYTKPSCRKYAERFQHPGIRALLENITGSDYSAIAIAATVGTLSGGDGGYPEGGSLRMAQNMANTFLSLGGKIEYKTQVKKVLVENDRVIGTLVNGEKRKADTVIVTQDTLQAIDTLFDTPLREKWAEDMRLNTRPLLSSFLCLGVEADLSELPESIIIPLDKPLESGGMQYDNLTINNYANYPGYAPEGCTALTSILMGDNYDYWKCAKVDGSYADKKAEVVEKFKELLAEKLPQIAGKIVVWDLATPLTYERYCGSHKGSWMSFLSPGEKFTLSPLQPKITISGLYLAGQRMMSPGGMSAALVTGRQAVQLLCRDNNMVFDC